VLAPCLRSIGCHRRPESFMERWMLANCSPSLRLLVQISKLFALGGFITISDARMITFMRARPMRSLTILTK
jgi:hypothetical protein